MSVRDWVALGLLGQFLFSARFVVQWICSERQHRSVMPMAFWYLSMAGGTILLVYAAHQRDPVFVVGQAGGLAIYLRNVQLRLREPASPWKSPDA